MATLVMTSVVISQSNSDFSAADSMSIVPDRLIPIRLEQILRLKAPEAGAGLSAKVRKV